MSNCYSNNQEILSKNEKIKSTYISLGSNVKNSEQNLKTALEYINLYPKTKIGLCSKIYLTEPQGDKNQPWFYNQIIRLDYNQNDFDNKNEALLLLDFLLETEKKMGRIRDINRRFGPRIIDLDILLFTNEIINSNILTIPHPRMSERAFILIPLQEIAPNLIINDLTINEALGKISYQIKQNKIFQA